MVTLIEPALQNRRGGNLVDHPPLIPGAHPSLTQGSRCADGSQSFIGQSHRDRADHPGDGIGHPDRIICGQSGPIRQGAGQTDDDLNDLQFPDQRSDPAQVPGPAIAPNRLHRRGQNRIWIADRHPDTDRAHVDPEPASPSRVVSSRPVGKAILVRHT